MTVTVIGSMPPVGFIDENGIAATSHATAKAPVGSVFTAWDPATNNWSVLAYYQAAASILKGDALTQDDSQYGTYKLVRATTTYAGQLPRGFAAAAVNNTGYYSYRYIAGYCPAIKFGSGVASNQVAALSASFTAGLTKFNCNATLGTSVAATVFLACVYSLDVNTTTTVNSGIISGFLL
jgi:hypothetical protein